MGIKLPDGNVVKTTKNGEISLGTKLTSTFTSLGKNLASKYGTRALVGICDATKEAVTTAENIRKPDGSAYTGGEKFDLAKNLFLSRLKTLGKDMSESVAMTLVELTVAELFGKK